MLTPAAFKLQFPAFATTSDERVQLFINKADPYFDVARWGDFYDDGVANFVAHNLFLTGGYGGSTPPVGSGMQDNTTSKKVGDVQISKSTALIQAAMTDPYMRTSFGQRFTELRRLVGVGAISV